MTDHPITPPPELIEQWLAEIWHEGAPVRVAASDLHIAIQAARWGADQELEACRNWIRHEDGGGCGLTADWMYEARRPKSPSLKEQALDSWDRLRNEAWCQEIDLDLDTIRRALEALPNG